MMLKKALDDRVENVDMIAACPAVRNSNVVKDRFSPRAHGGCSVSVRAIYKQCWGPSSMLHG